MNYDIASRELELYATNTECHIAPVIKTLSKKYRAGVFSLDRAIDYIDKYCLIPAAKQYTLENGSMADKWSRLFDKATRQVAAENIARQWVAEFRLGNFWD